MKEGYIIQNQEAPHFVTFTVVDRTVRRFAGCFIRKVYRDILLESLKFCQEHKGLILTGYVLMRMATLKITFISLPNPVVVNFLI